ncbi:protein CYSTEINE-RICH TRANSMEMBRANE MODULE 9-like [Rutidosis leptorrhynchoides]|uniref:protein CYSTEINE-RICH TRANSMEMBRANE MODULE 9-like n=1 Tax=Rutidosis leptorrhynchoides TaxID=125765 RepID=UPI003A99E798
MSNFAHNQNQNQNEIPVAYPPSQQGVSYVTAPPPVGYPTMKSESQNQGPIQTQTQSRGDGFWKGCCAALCCCCVLDACF